MRKKSLRIQKYPDTCGRGLKESITNVDSSVLLMRSDPSDIRSVFLIAIAPKERILKPYLSPPLKRIIVKRNALKLWM